MNRDNDTSFRIDTGDPQVLAQIAIDNALYDEDGYLLRCLERITPWDVVALGTWDGEPVGVALFQDWELQVYVVPELRRHGLGLQLALATEARWFDADEGAESAPFFSRVRAHHGVEAGTWPVWAERMRSAEQDGSRARHAGRLVPNAPRPTARAAH